MQLLAVLNIFIAKTQLNSIFTNDLKRNFFFRKMFIVTDLVSLANGQNGKVVNIGQYFADFIFARVTRLTTNYHENWTTQKFPILRYCTFCSYMNGIFLEC